MATARQKNIFEIKTVSSYKFMICSLSFSKKKIFFRVMESPSNRTEICLNGQDNGFDGEIRVIDVRAMESLLYRKFLSFTLLYRLIFQLKEKLMMIHKVICNSNFVQVSAANHTIQTI